MSPIIHIIAGLRQGGAEATLYRLMSACVNRKIHSVVSLTGEDYYGERLRALGVTVETLNMPRGRVTISGLYRLFHLLRAQRSAVVHTWMYHANLAGGLLARLAGVRRVVWCIRHSNLDSDRNSRGLRKVAKLGALLSAWVPTCIVFNSEESLRSHAELGYVRQKMVLIPNGYSLATLFPDENTGKALRVELCVPPNIPLVGMVARWDPQKDHANLFSAMSRVWAIQPQVYLLCAGVGMTRENNDLWQLVLKAGGEGKTLLLGSRDDIPRVMNALDLHILSSIGEAFPNAVAEAMACGTPCVVTDVGDARLIVGDTGWIAPAADPDALARKILDGLTDLQGSDNIKRRACCRQRIEENFSLDRMIAAYQQVWHEKPLRRDS